MLLGVGRIRVQHGVEDDASDASSPEAEEVVAEVPSVLTDRKGVWTVPDIVVATNAHQWYIKVQLLHRRLESIHLSLYTMITMVGVPILGATWYWGMFGSACVKSPHAMTKRGRGHNALIRCTARRHSLSSSSIDSFSANMPSCGSAICTKRKSDCHWRPHSVPSHTGPQPFTHKLPFDARTMREAIRRKSWLGRPR